MAPFLISAGVVLVFCVAVTFLCVALWRSGVEAVAEAPLLDVVVSALTWLPWVAAGWLAGWKGVAGCFLGQFLALQAFCILHERMRKRSGRVLCGEINRLVGPASNHFGLWATVPALPAFIMIRVAELVFYPMLVWTLRFPRYRQADWVNVSRQKFEGLIGHDLVWCLYCDWMTGVYSLGGEMLRNVESFWCPIRFYSNKKCENCRTHFPDVDEWVPPEGNIQDARAKWREKYRNRKGAPRSWFGHPERKAKRGRA